VRQPVKRTSGFSREEEIRLRAELARARQTIRQLKSETFALRQQLTQQQQRRALSQTMVPQPRLKPQTSRLSMPAHPLTRSPHQIGSPQKPGAAGFDWSRSANHAVGQRPLPPSTHPPSLRRKRRLKRKAIQPWRRLLSSLISMVGLAVLIGTTLSLRPPASRSPAPSTNISTTQPSAATPPSAPPAAFVNGHLVYNVRQEPVLRPNPALQGVVDSAVALAVQKGFKAEELSISLINLKTNEIADHQGSVMRHPASVAKFFWMVMAYAQIEQGMIVPDEAFTEDMRAMVVVSDNDAASRILDRITQAESGAELAGEAFTTWFNKRMQANEFFRQSGFTDLYVAQKNYPVYSIGMPRPSGREKQLKDAQNRPLRSLVSTNQAARLMYDIYNGLAVSRARSQEMITLMKRDLRPEVWKKDPLNCVAGFLGEYLPPNTIFAGKIGYTTEARHEVAFVETPDQKTAYVLAVFGDSASYSRSGTILPEISRHVYNKMTATGVEGPQPPATEPQVSPSNVL